MCKSRGVLCKTRFFWLKGRLPTRSAADLHRRERLAHQCNHTRVAGARQAPIRTTMQHFLANLLMYYKSGADLRRLVSSAVVRAARRDADAVGMADFVASLGLSSPPAAASEIVHPAAW